jgi:FKBP-type peptidyl-prolyl cis-trans isomerase SlyD
VVTIDYTLKDDKGVVIDTSVGRQPLPYIHGAGNLIAGLEKALEGKDAGAQMNVTIAPEDAYGVHDEKLIQAVPKTAFQGVPSLQVGMQFRSQGHDGHQQIVRITKIEGETVTVDANHALAGQTLHFDVTIKDVRAATEEELAHGHVHGPDGHHHH